MEPRVIRDVTVTTNTEYDTILVPVKEKIDFTDLSFSILEDSIDYYKQLYEEELKNIKIVSENEPFSAPLRRYSGFEPTLYGNIGYDAVVAGKMLDMSIKQDLRIPEIRVSTNTTRTITRDIRGLYAGASVTPQLDYKIGASYVNRDWQINYDYQPRYELHWVGVKKRVF